MVDEVEAIADPVERWKALDRLKRDTAKSRRRISKARTRTVNELRALVDEEHPEGWSLKDIGDLTGETRSTIQYVAEGRGLARESAADAEGPDAS
jgi:hypothetical protein